jgi:hypothetical protein
MKEGKFGVLNNIICLYSDIKISEVLDLLTRRIYDEVKKMHPGVKIGIPAQQIRAEHTLPQIESRCEQILRNQDWTWGKVLADAKSTCGSSGRERSIILDKNFNPEKTAQHFQVIFIITIKLANKIKHIFIAGPDQKHCLQDSRKAFDNIKSRPL